MIWSIPFIDKARCPFPVPDFATPPGEQAWAFSLTPNQRLMLLRLGNEVRWGRAAMERPMDRKVFQILTMEEFNEIKRIDEIENAKWEAEIAQMLASSES